MRSLRTVALLFLAACVLGSALYLRLRPRPRPDVATAEEAVVPQAPPTAEPPAPDTPPTDAEVRPVLVRSFAGAVLPDDRDARWFAIGDFDGDGCADLAALVRVRDAEAAGALAGPSTAFRLQDAAAPGPLPSPGRVGADERFLAVVHGVPGGSWSDGAVARPLHLVRGGPRAGLRSRPLAGLPDAVRMRIARAHVGDVLAGTRAGAPGFVFWNGAAYVWAELPEAKAATGGGRSSLP
jgi:hypothetical protein